MRLFVMVTLFALHALGGGAAKNVNPQLADSLEKVNSQIEVTRLKIRTSKEVDFIPDLQFMLAELLIEKSRMMSAIKLEQNPNAQKSGMDFTAERSVQMSAVDQLKMMEERYPTYPALDRVLFTQGFELNRLQETDSSIRAYKRLIEKFPQSSLTPRAQIEVGGIYFEKKDYEYALDQFKKVLETAENTAVSTAAYKAGWCEIHRGNFLQSMIYFERVFASSTADSPAVDSEMKKTDLREDALIASVWPFSELTDKDLRANPRFLKPIAYYLSVSADKVLYRKALKRLAQRLELKGRLREASDVSEELLLASSDLDESLQTMQSFYSLRRKAKIEAVNEETVEKISSVLYLAAEKGRMADLAKYEVLDRDLLTRAHRAALLVRRRDDLRTVVRGYEHYLKIYPTTKYRSAIMINIAEAAYAAKDFAVSAKFYSNVSLLLGKSPGFRQRSKMEMDSAIQAYNQALAGSEELTLTEKMQMRWGYRNLVDIYVAKFPTDSNLPALRFNYAKSLYDEQRYNEAAEFFRQYLKLYPKSDQAKQVAVLLLDCHYLQDDSVGMLAEGKKMLVSGGFDVETQAKVRQIIEQAQLKSVLSVAGEFATRKYADKFLEMAKRNKGTSLSEQSLFEAFSSLRAAKDEKVYEVGEQYIAQNPDKPRTKEILNHLIQTSLVTMDLGRASEYMRAFSQRFPSDPLASKYRLQALTLLEQTGQATEAIDAALELKDQMRAARTAAMFGHWATLGKISAGISGPAGLYYQGLSLWRQGQGEQGLSLLRRAFETTSSDLQVKEMSAHAGFIIGERQVAGIRSFDKEAFSAALLQKMISHYQSANLTLQQVFQQGVGRWSIGSLALTARLNDDFSRMLKKALPPQGMNPDQFKQMISLQTDRYDKIAKEEFVKCIELAEKEEILTNYGRMCRTNGSSVVHEIEESKPRIEGSRVAVFISPKIRSELMQTPKSMTVLRQAYATNLKQKNFYGAYAIASRMTEIEPGTAQTWADLGHAAHLISATDEAVAAYRTALAKTAKQSDAIAGLNRLFESYGFDVKSRDFTSAHVPERLPASTPGGSW